MDIEKWVIRKTETCPKKYRFIVNNQLLKYSAEAYTQAKMGNSVRVTNLELKILREKHFVKSYAALQAFVAQIDVIYAVCKSNFLTNRELEIISADAFYGMKLVHGVIKSDKERYKNIK